MTSFLVLTLLTIGGGAAAAAAWGDSFDDAFDTYDPYDTYDTYDPYDPFEETPATDDPFVTPETGVDGGYPFMPGVDSSVPVYASPSLSSSVVGYVDSDMTVNIVCTAYGDNVASPNSGSTDLWNQIDYPSGYIPDAYINTGTNAAVAEAC